MNDPADPSPPGDDGRPATADDAARGCEPDGDSGGTPRPQESERAAPWPPGPGDRAGPAGWWAGLRDEVRDRVAGVDGGGLRLAAGGAAVVALALAGWWLLRPGPAPAESALPPLDAVAPTTAAPGGGSGAASTSAPGAVAGKGGAGAGPVSSGGEGGDGTITAHAAGAVASPGVYELGDGARVADLVDAAGGLAPEADADRLNLAAPVGDGARVYVPARGEAEVPEVAGLPEPPRASGGGGGGTTGRAEATGPAAPVDLNTATAAELEGLPGVGPVTSAAILEHRTQNGGFSSVDELIEVSGIGDAKMATLRDLVTV